MTSQEIQTLIERKTSQIELLEKELFDLNCFLRKQRDEELERAKRVEHERIRTCYTTNGSQFQACASAVTSRAGVRRYFVGAGLNGKLLAAWEVTEHRGDKFATLVRGSNAPTEVELAIFRTFELRKP